MNILRKINLRTFILMIGCFLTINNYIFANLDRNQSLLNETLKKQGIVGTVLIYFYNKEPYALLARQIKDQTFSDLGGVAQAGKKIGESMINILNEETSNKFNFKELEFSNNVYLITNETSAGRYIVYGIYALNDEQFKEIKGLSAIGNKDLFVWLPIKELLNKETKEEVIIKDINGSEQKIKIRSFFLENCLMNPDFKKAIEELSLKQD